jgi:Domain of unknown function (DUF4167)
MRNAQTGRRRGRGNNPRPPQGGRDMGNRTMEPRQRGNAVQLLEKYNNLARDSQQQGDRVQAEYYMQYADHYHRVVAEMRARHEERQAQYQQHDRQRGRDDRERDDRERDDRERDGDGRDDRDHDEDDRGDEDVAAEAPAMRPHRPAAPRAAREDDEDDVGGALRTLARSARTGEVVEDHEAAAAGDADVEGDARPRRGRGRPRRQPRDVDATREPVEA